MENDDRLGSNNYNNVVEFLTKYNMQNKNTKKGHQFEKNPKKLEQ